MLVLSRRRGDTIWIGANICITIVDVLPDGKVRVGVTAPRDVPVHRGEVYDKIVEQGTRRLPNVGPNAEGDER